MSVSLRPDRQIIQDTISRVVVIEEALELGDVDSAYQAARDLEADLVGYLTRRWQQAA